MKYVLSLITSCLLLCALVSSFTYAQMHLASTSGILTEISGKYITLKIGDLTLQHEIALKTRIVGLSGDQISLLKLTEFLRESVSIGIGGIPVDALFGEDSQVTEITVDKESYANKHKALTNQVQTFLSLLGYDPGPIDGKFGNKTIMAIKNFQKDENLQPTGEMSLGLLQHLVQKKGCDWIDKENSDTVLHCYNILVESDPENSISLNKRGFFYYSLGQYSLSLEDYNKALLLDPLYYQAFINRGALYIKIGDYSNAIIDFSNAIKCKPKSPDGYANRGVAYYYSGEKEKACIDFDTSCKLGNCTHLEMSKKNGLCK